MVTKFANMYDPGFFKSLETLGADMSGLGFDYEIRNYMIPGRRLWLKHRPRCCTLEVHELHYVDAIVFTTVCKQVRGNSALVTPEMVLSVYKAQLSNREFLAFLDDLHVHAGPDNPVTLSFAEARRLIFPHELP